MLTDSGLEILRAANIIFPIGTFEDIHVSFHLVFNYWSPKYRGKIVVERSRNNNFSHEDSIVDTPVVERSRNERHS